MEVPLTEPTAVKVWRWASANVYDNVSIVHKKNKCKKRVAYGHHTFNRLRCWFFYQRYLFTMNSNYVRIIKGQKLELDIYDLILLYLRWNIRIFSFLYLVKTRRDKLRFNSFSVRRVHFV
jgi:hypothetical protein